MGKQSDFQQNPLLGMGEAFKRYDATLETLACRMLAEPYNAQSVEAEIAPEMLIGTYGEVIAECQKQFREDRQYTPQSVAFALKRDKSSLLNWAGRDAEIELPAAFDMFLHAYEQYIEIQVASTVATWIGQGMSSAEICVEANKFRKTKGIRAKQHSDDGKDEFEKELLLALDGKAIEYPVKPPLSAIRQHVPFFEPGEYIIVAGRTGMGKSFFAMNTIYEASKAGMPSVYINLENKPKHMQKRLWQMETGIKFQRGFKGLLQSEVAEYMLAWERVKDFPTKVANPGRDLHQVTNMIRQEYYERGIQLAVIDYIQLMRDSSRKLDRLSELAEISAALRALALDLDLPIIVLAQMNRESEKSADKRPTLTGLRGAGNLEEDATMVFLLYVPGYYEITVDQDLILYPEEYADIHIAKGRESGPGMAKCRFNAVKGFHDALPEVPHQTTTPYFQTIPAAAINAARREV